jgi:hypothetical protein
VTIFLALRYRASIFLYSWMRDDEIFRSVVFSISSSVKVNWIIMGKPKFFPPIFTPFKIKSTTAKV